MLRLLVCFTTLQQVDSTIYFTFTELAQKPEITIIPQPAKIERVEQPVEPVPMEADVATEDDDEEEDESDSDLEFIMPKAEDPSDDCTIIETDLPQDSQTKPQPNGKQQERQELFIRQLQQQHLQNLHLQHRSLAKMRIIRQKGENGDSNGTLIIGSDPEDHDIGSPEMPMTHGRSLSQDSFEDPNGNNSHLTPSRQPARRRARRKNLASDDQAEALTEMSVRGLNLFRYASISDGVYQCMECAKENVQKTFKNKYSFQRHAFLYHEGAQRKVFPCPVCNKEFSRPDKMKNHLKTTHESYMPKPDQVYPMGYIVGSNQEQGQIPPNHASAKIESVLSAIQLQQHLNLQKELQSQHAKFQLQHQQLISPVKLMDNGGGGVPAIVASGGGHLTSQ